MKRGDETKKGFPGGSDSKKNLPAMQEIQVQSLDWEDKGMATHSSILAWEIPWTEEPGRLQSMGSPKRTLQHLLKYKRPSTVPVFLVCRNKALVS